MKGKANPKPRKTRAQLDAEEDAYLNRIADARLAEPQIPIEELFRKLGYVPRYAGKQRHSH